MRSRLACLAAALSGSLIPGAALAQATLDETGIRAFVTAQERAWNGRDFAAYFDRFTPDATFTDQAYAGDRPPVPYGTSSLPKARAQVVGGKARSRELGEIMRIEIAPGGASAKVVSRIGSTVSSAGRVRRLCASRMQILVLRRGQVRASRQVDTYVRCRR